MPKNKRSRDQVETYESDGGIISNDDGNAPKSKKSKKAGTSKPNTSSDDQHWALSSGRTPRRVNISKYKNSKLVNIREYYEKDNDYLPSKKGISLTIKQYKALLKAILEINAALKEVGANVGNTELLDEEEEPVLKKERMVKTKKERANIEEMSEDKE